jgi:hypothetical protein
LDNRILSGFLEIVGLYLSTDGAIEFGRWSIRGGQGEGTEEENATGTRAGFGFGEVGCVTVHVKTHFAGMEAYHGIRMQGGIIKEMDGSFGSSQGAPDLGEG